MDALARALDAAKEGRLEEALDALLEAWRKSKVPALADAIDEVSAVLTTREPPVRASGPKSATKVWHATVDSYRPAALGRLLESVAKGSDSPERLGKLDQLREDPRLSGAVCRWLRDPPVRGKGRGEFFAMALALLARMDDVRARPLLQELTTPEAQVGAIRVAGLSNWKRLCEVAREIAALRVREPTPDETALLAGLRKALGAGRDQALDPAALLAQVYARPEDDGVRAVLSDALLERGDPRGEFVALQLARQATGEPPSTRERALADHWGRAWLGAIEPYVMRGGTVFERGFVARCRLAGGLAQAARCPEWATVTHLDAFWAGRFAGGSGALLLSGGFKSLRHVTGVGREDLAAVLRAGPLPWRTLGLGLERWSDSGALATADPKALPELRALELRAASGPISDLDLERVTRLARRFPSLTELAVDAPRSTAAGLLAGLVRSALARVVVVCNGVRYERSGTELLVVPAILRAAHEAEIAHIVGRLRALGLERVRLAPEDAEVRDGAVLRRGRNHRMRLAPLERAALDAGLELVVDAGAGP